MSLLEAAQKTQGQFEVVNSQAKTGLNKALDDSSKAISESSNALALKKKRKSSVVAEDDIWAKLSLSTLVGALNIPIPKEPEDDEDAYLTDETDEVCHSCGCTFSWAYASLCVDFSVLEMLFTHTHTNYTHTHTNYTHTLHTHFSIHSPEIPHTRARCISCTFSPHHTYPNQRKWKSSKHKATKKNVLVKFTQA